MDPLTKTIELFRPPTLSGQAPYAYASACQGASRLVFTAGACPLDEHGMTVSVGDVAGQAEQVMVNLVQALTAGGATLSDVVKSTVYVATTRQADLLAVWEVVDRAFGDPVPPSTLVGVTVLGYPDQLVEIEAIAAIA